VDRVRALANPIRHYAWGSRTALAELTGRPVPSPEPEAELWVGAHPTAPSQVETDAGLVPLPDWIARAPERVLGAAVAARFGGELPFLLKLLAVERPLSLQAHPDAARARAGCAREDAAGIPRSDSRRCYPDPRHKPELVCALRPFRTLVGPRPPADAAARVEALGVPAFARVAAALRAGDGRAAFAALFAVAPAERPAAVAAAGRAAAARGEEDAAFALAAELAAAHPGDVAALAPLLLQLVTLAPGEALFLAPGELHTHLGGLAVEVMANSDAVVRGGLTEKPVDVAELLAIGRFAGAPATPLAARADGGGARAWPAPCVEFALSALHVEPAAPAGVGGSGGVEIVLCTAGALALGPHPGVHLRPGQAALVPAAAGPQRVAGSGEAYRVCVPLS
jgi:mannose-6-phosphate isomerase